MRGVRAAGFSLPELLLALALGLTLSAMALQAMVGDGSQAMRLSRLLRERAVQRRTLADLWAAHPQSAAPIPAEPWAL